MKKPKDDNQQLLILNLETLLCQIKSPEMGVVLTFPCFAQKLFRSVSNQTPNCGRLKFVSPVFYKSPGCRNSNEMPALSSKIPRNLCEYSKSISGSCRPPLIAQHLPFTRKRNMPFSQSWQKFGACLPAWYIFKLEGILNFLVRLCKVRKFIIISRYLKIQKQAL